MKNIFIFLLFVMVIVLFIMNAQNAKSIALLKEQGEFLEEIKMDKGSPYFN